jgi:hypothetical protein
MSDDDYTLLHCYSQHDLDAAVANARREALTEVLTRISELSYNAHAVEVGEAVQKMLDAALIGTAGGGA